MSIKKVFKSLGDALVGLRFVFLHEQNFRIEMFIGIVVLLFAWFFNIRTSEFIVVLLLIMFVLVLEIVNTVMEYMLDMFKPRLHHRVGMLKDITAGMVLIASIGAAIIGFVIFMPYIVDLFIYA